jgi:hypothetical protein
VKSVAVTTFRRTDNFSAWRIQYIRQADNSCANLPSGEACIAPYEGEVDCHPGLSGGRSRAASQAAAEPDRVRQRVWEKVVMTMKDEIDEEKFLLTTDQEGYLNFLDDLTRKVARELKERAGVAL